MTEFDAEVVTATSPSELIKISSPIVSVIENIRQPASVIEANSEILNISLNCEEAKRTQESPQSLVMLNLNLCREIKNSSVSIINTTNGFKAQLFKLTAKNYRTDFIQLSKGTNILVIESVLKDGQKKVQTLEILSGS